MKHLERHPNPVAGCFGCRIIGVRFASSIFASRTPNTNRDTPESVQIINAREARWNRDMPAYKRLRANGLQPPTVEGAAQLEAHATEPEHVNSGGHYDWTREHIRTAEELIGGKVTQPRFNNPKREVVNQ